MMALQRRSIFVRGFDKSSRICIVHGKNIHFVKNYGSIYKQFCFVRK